MAGVRVLAGGALLGAGTTALMFGTPYLDQFIEQSIVRSTSGKVYGDLGQLMEERKSRRLPVVPDEFVAEISSIGRHLGMDLNLIKLVLVPMGSMPATGGTRVIPGLHAYLIVPDSRALDCMIGGARKTYKTAFPDTHNSPGDCVIEPNQRHLTFQPADRYEIAHELAHIKNEDYVKRWMVQGACVLALAAMPLVGLRRGLDPRLATLPAMLSIVPGFFGLKKLNRMQELRADEVAAQAGYAVGGYDFWSIQMDLYQGKDPAFHLWKNHPQPSERLALMAKYAPAQGLNSTAHLIPPHQRFG